MATLEDVYMAILWPNAIGQSNNYILFSRGSINYEQNDGLDLNRDGKVTKQEAAAKVASYLQKGLQPGNVA